MDPDDVNAPAAEEAQDQPQEQPEEQTEAPEPQETQPSEETQDTAAPEGEEAVETSQVTQEQPEQEIDWSQYVPNVQGNIPTDENGQVDPQQFRQQLKDELRFEQQTIRAWTRLEQERPEIKTDAGLRDMIVANQLYNVQRGGKGSLEEAANSVFERIGEAKNQGKAAQATSIKVQKSAALEKPSGNKTVTTPDARDRIRAGDQSAIQSQLASWLDDGKI